MLPAPPSRCLPGQSPQPPTKPHVAPLHARRLATPTLRPFLPHPPPPPPPPLVVFVSRHPAALRLSLSALLRSLCRANCRGTFPPAKPLPVVRPASIAIVAGGGRTLGDAVRVPSTLLDDEVAAVLAAHAFSARRRISLEGRDDSWSRERVRNEYTEPQPVFWSNENCCYMTTICQDFGRIRLVCVSPG